MTPIKAKCSKCSKIPNEKKLSVTCDLCKCLLCSDCHGLSPTEIRVFELKTVVRVMSYLCGDCKSAMVQLPMLMKKVDELTEEVKQLRTRQSMLTMESTIQEVAERKYRAQNVIIYDIPESTSADVNERKEHDLKESSAIINSVSNKVSCVGIKTFRLGAKVDGSGGDATSRPLKVVLRSKKDALDVLRNKKKLQRPASIKADLTPQQREYLQHLREELNKRITDGEMDITIKYIRGRPAIVKTKSNLDSNTAVVN